MSLVQLDGEHVVETCPECKTQHTLPIELYRTARAQRGSKGVQVHCPHGHTWHYVEGESESDRLRRENQRLKQREAHLNDCLAYQEHETEKAKNQARAFKGHNTRLKNRAANGVCPCCNRTFSNLAQHMKTKHPDFSTKDENNASRKPEKKHVHA